MHTNDRFKNHTLCAISVVGALLAACSDDSSNVGKVGAGGGAGKGGGGAPVGPTTTTGAGTSTGGASTASTGTIGVTGTTGGGGAATTAASTTGTAGTTGSAGSGGSTGSGGAAGMAGSGGGDGGPCEPANVDTDMDGTPDCAEECIFDKNKTVPGICGCGFVDNDSDGDNKIDCIPGKFYEAENGQLSSSDAGTNDPDASTASGGFTIGMETAASNGRYILAPAGVTSEGQPGSAHASYDFNITKADVYGIWGRFYSPDPAHDCFWARMDGGIWTKWRNTTGAEWFWYLLHKEGDWTAPLTFTLTAGHHAFEIANCTDNTKLDRLYVGAGGERPPQDVTTCNPPHTVAINSLCVSSCGQLGGTSCDPAMCAGKLLLPAYDCTVCCNPSVSSPDAGDTDAADGASPADTGTNE